MIKSVLNKIYAKQLFSVWLLASFFIAQGPMQDMVVCIGADGHIEVEAASEGVCASDLGRNSTEIHSLSSNVKGDDHCGSCVDIPFSIGNADRQKLRTSLKTSHLSKVPAGTDVFVDMSNFRDRSSGVPFLRYDHQKSNTLASIRSTILII